MAIIELAERALIEVETLKQAAQDYANPELGEISLAASHTQARYALRPVIESFVERYPRVAIHLHQGTPRQIAELVNEGKVDLAIATEAMEHFEDLVTLPCYHWHRGVVVPGGHPLASVSPLTLEAVAEHPLVTYVFGFTGRSVLDNAFRRARIETTVRLTATDADIIKSYVRLGLGVGIIARMAYDPVADAELKLLDASHLFDRSTVKIALRRGTYLRSYMYDFLELFAPHLSREVVEAALQLRTRSALDPLFMDAQLPVY